MSRSEMSPGAGGARVMRMRLGGTDSGMSPKILQACALHNTNCAFPQPCHDHDGREGHGKLIRGSPVGAKLLDAGSLYFLEVVAILCTLVFGY